MAGAFAEDALGGSVAETLKQRGIVVGQFLRLLLTRFIEDQGLPNAASLTFNTLLSLVPLMTVSLAVFAAFPISDRVEQQIQDFLFFNFMPESGAVLQSYLSEFTAKASSMTGTGFLFLIVVALMMMANIDRAFNTIWRVKRKRSPLSMFMMYWSILSLGPILIGISVALTSYLVTLPLLSDAVESLAFGQRLFGLIVPTLVSVIAFTLLYAIVPNRRVPLRHAFAGGLVAALLFEAAKRGFAFYITNFPTYEAIYGALAALPIFLIWLYLSWTVTLIGAEFSYCLGIYRDQIQLWQGRRGEMLLAYRLMERLWVAQKAGRSLSVVLLSRSLDQVAEERIEDLLQQLLKARMVLRTDDNTWALARDLSEVSLSDLYRSSAFILPSHQALEGAESVADRNLADLLLRLDGNLDSLMAVSLETLFSGPEQPR